MNPGLRYLLRKKPVGWFRTVTRRARGTKGLLLLLGGAVFAALIIGPQVFVASLATQDEMMSNAESIRLWGPPALMLMALMGTTSGAGLHFRQSEIDFLFAAPVNRRELLFYHVLGKLSVVLLTSLWIAIFVLRWAPRWYGGLVGVFFALCFVQLATQLASLLLATLSAKITKRVRRFLLLGLVVSTALLVWLTHRQMGPETTLVQAARELAGSTGVAVITAPTRVFIELFTSANASSFATWGVASLGILVALFVAITRVDVAYTEAAVRVSQDVQERLRRMRAGGGAAAAPSSGTLRLSLPTLPWLGGAGPLAWRQGIEALRNARGIAMMALMSIGVPMVIVATSSAEQEGPSAGVMGFMMIFMMTLMMAPQLALDFRRDLDRMGYLKTLPLSSTAVAFGQLLPSVVIITLIQGIACLGLVLVFDVVLPCPWPMLLLLLPFSLLAMAVDNVLFLWFPHRFVPKEAGNVQFMGRTMLCLFAKMLALMVIGGVAAGIAWGVHAATASLLFAGLAAAIVLGAAGIAVTFLLGRAFHGFDAKDVPG